jgi:hypothetical protein
MRPLKDISEYSPGGKKHAQRNLDYYLAVPKVPRAEPCYLDDSNTVCQLLGD